MAVKAKVKDKKSASKKVLSKKPAAPSKTKAKKVVSPELQEAHERAQWQKEKRLYWSSRFSRVLAEMATKPKAKKASAL